MFLVIVTIITLSFVFVSHVVSHLVQEEKVAVAKAKDFLESNTYSADDPYTTALSAYALALLRSPYAPRALRRLNHMAITQGSAALITASNTICESLDIPIVQSPETTNVLAGDEHRPDAEGKSSVTT